MLLSSSENLCQGTASLGGGSKRSRSLPTQLSGAASLRRLRPRQRLKEIEPATRGAMQPAGLPAIDDDALPEGRSARTLQAIVTWVFAIVGGKAGYPKLDPNVVVLNKGTLRRVGKVMSVYSTRPLINGATVILELLARMVMLILFMALSCTPRSRSTVMERVRLALEARVQHVRRCARCHHPSAPPRPPGVDARRTRQKKHAVPL